jgi:signal transduction histidine kinase/CheY-like chemotaxis protein
MRALFRTISRRCANLSLWTKGLALVAVPIGALLFSLLLDSRLQTVRTETEDLIRNSNDVRAQLQNMYIVLIAAESEVRNFGLNHLEEGLQPLGMVGPSITAAFAKLDDLIQPADGERGELAGLRPLVYQRLNGLKELRAYYSSPDGQQVPPPASLIRQARISPDALLAFNEFGTKLFKSRLERIKNGESRQATLRSMLVWTGVAGVAAGVLAALLFAWSRSRRVRRLTDSALHLDDGLPPGDTLASKDELGRLAQAMEKAARTVAERSEELKLALEGAEVLIWELEPASGSIRYQTGSGALRNASIPPELLPESVGKWMAVVQAEDRDRVRKELDTITADGGSFQIEYRVVIRGGETRWMSVKAQSHSVGGAKPQRLLGVLADITAEKLAAQKIELQAQELSDSREALEQQTRILQSILDSMGDGVIVTDTRGKFLLFNPAARQILGSDAFTGEPRQWAQHYGLFLPDMVSLYPTDQFPLLRAIRGESVDEAEIYVRPAGTMGGTWSSFTARPLRQEDGEVRGGVVVIRDITASKRDAETLKLAKREAEDANHAKSEFLSRMSHELRTPLNSILGFAQILELGALNEQQSDNVAHILKGGYHLLDLINEILDLARIEAGRLSLSLEPVRVREALKDAVDLVRPLAIQQNVTINPDVAIRCDRHVQADRQRLKQVLLNLLSNAIKYNRGGGSVVISCCETPGNSLRIEVVDTGTGISNEGLKRIFRPFERLGADGTDVGGTGLGLALSKRLVESMGGTMGVESTVGLGSRFFIEFGIIEDPAKALATNDAPALLAGSGARSHRGTVLYIEDNASNLSLVEQIFSHSPDIRLLSAMQGQLGLDLAELHSPDWILLDVHLPDLSGDEVLRRLRLNPRTCRIPVTVLSADATTGQIARLMDWGARDYLTKPLDVRKLLSLLEQTIPNGSLTAAPM